MREPDARGRARTRRGAARGATPVSPVLPRSVVVHYCPVVAGRRLALISDHIASFAEKGRSEAGARHVSRASVRSGRARRRDLALV